LANNYRYWYYKNVTDKADFRLLTDNRCISKSYEQFLLQMEAITCLPQNRHLSQWPKMNGTQTKALVSPWRMYCVHGGMEKGTSWAKMMSYSKQNQVRSLSHCWIMWVWRRQAGSHAGKQTGKQLLSQPIKIIF